MNRATQAAWGPFPAQADRDARMISHRYTHPWWPIMPKLDLPGRRMQPPPAFGPTAMKKKPANILGCKHHPPHLSGQRHRL